MISAIEAPSLNVPAMHSVSVQAANVGERGNLLENVKPSFMVLSCQQIESGSEYSSAERAMDPALLTRILLKSREHIAVDEKKMFVRILEGPKHGKLRTEVTNTEYRFFAYDPDPNFLGKDQVIFLVEFEGKIYKQIRTIQVVKRADESEDQKICPIDSVVKTNRK